MARKICLRREIKIKYRFKKNAAIFALIGDLGAGKTTFIQGFLNGLNIRQRAVSPTFVLMRRFGNVYHLDAYRIKKTSEFEKLGIEDIFKNPENIVFIEWADRIRQLIPRDAVWIKFNYGERESERLIEIKFQRSKAKSQNCKSKLKKF